jgi:3-hydroxyisobutyrate dehydrogenase/2-hydroxy-3-oxopropionate reductase
MARVAVLGLGAMGSRIAARLLDAGHELVVWNRTPERAEPLVARGAEAAPTPAAAADGAELVLTMLADPDALFAVVTGEDGLTAGVREGATVVEMSTVGPAAVRRLRELLPRGVEVVDAPVLGSRDEAAGGRLVVFVGGTDTAFARVAQALDSLGTVRHVGPFGSGAAAKLVANSTLFGALGVLGEALALAETLGLSRHVAFEVLAATPLAAQAERRRPAIESAEFPPRFPLSLARKDADLIVEAARSAGVDLRLAAAARAWLAEAEADDPDRDYAAMLERILVQARISAAAPTRRA